MNEKKLLIKLINKKRGALDTAVNHYTGYVAAIVYRTSGGSLTKEDIEETISDVFVALWRNTHRLDENLENIRGYLGAIARNTTRNKIRTLHYNENVEDVADLFIEPDGSPEDKLLLLETGRLLLQAIEQMGEPDCNIFFRYFFQDEKLWQIAEALDMKLPTVKTRFGRGKAKLKKLLVEMGVGFNEK